MTPSPFVIKVWVGIFVVASVGGMIHRGLRDDKPAGSSSASTAKNSDEIDLPTMLEESGAAAAAGRTGAELMVDLALKTEEERFKAYEEILYQAARAGTNDRVAEALISYEGTLRESEGETGAAEAAAKSLEPAPSPRPPRSEARTRALKERIRAARGQK